MIAQRKAGSDLAWRTVGKLSCLHQEGSRLDPGVATDTSRMTLVTDLPSASVTVRRIRLSDYTESRWLPFIGSFDKAAPASTDDLMFTVNGDTLTLQSTHPGSEVPELRGLSDGLSASADDKDATDDPRFDLVLVSRSSRDVTRPDIQDGGQLVSVLWKQNGRLRQMQDYTAPLHDLQDCTAHIIRMQRVTSLSLDERKLLRNIRSFSELLEEIFPVGSDSNGVPALNKECLIRFLPEYVGPIRVLRG